MMNPTMSGRVLIWLVGLGLIQETRAGAYIEIRLISYWDKCKEDFWPWTNKCDPMFNFCIDKHPRIERSTWWPCHYTYTSRSGYFLDTNFVNFDCLGDINGIRNPLIVYTTEPLELLITFIAEVTDSDWVDDDYMTKFGIVMTDRAYPSKAEAQWSSKTISSGDYSMTFKIRIYCAENFHTERCDKYCLASDTAAGHYMCEKKTGNKVCKPGWKGPRCNELDNKCELMTCQRGICNKRAANNTCSCSQVCQMLNTTLQSPAP